MWIRSEKARLSEERRPSSAAPGVLRRRQAEGGGKGIRHAEELDRDLASRGGAGIARQPLCKREAVMRPLRTGEDRAARSRS